MIYDTIANIPTYEGINPRIMEGLKLLQTVDFANTQPGKVVINDWLWYNVMDYESSVGGRLEAHNDWADIQYIAAGSEYMGVKARCDMGEPVESKPQNDVWFFGGDYAKLEMGGDKFIVLYPQDGHAPGDGKADGEKIRRVVIKVKLV